MGLSPWLGNDKGDGSHETPYGNNYYLFTRKGLSKEFGYVGSYGETIMRFALDMAELSGDEKIRQQLIKIQNTRFTFRYPSMDPDGYRQMKPGRQDLDRPYRGAAVVDGRAAGGGRRRSHLRLLADHAGEVVTRDRPRVSATLPETGERFQGAFMPVVARPAFSIRKRPEVVFPLGDYVDGGMMSEAQADTIRAAAEVRQNLLIVGGTGSGKTTLANAVLAEPAFAGDRVALIEDTAELQCSAADQIQMLTKRTEPAVTMTDLVRDTLRLRPDRIVIGEVRDGSALDLLKAWNTGHPGGLATLHANSAAEGLSRLEDLIGEVTQRIPHRAIGQAIDLVIHIARTPGGRRVSELMRVTGWGEDGYIVQPA